MPKKRHKLLGYLSDNALCNLADAIAAEWIRRSELDDLEKLLEEDERGGNG